MIAAWSSRFLAGSTQHIGERSDAVLRTAIGERGDAVLRTAMQQEPALPPGLVEVRETKAGPLAQLVRAGNHRFPAGEPVSVGGDDSGPGPYDLLLAALGACSSMTMRLYADRKGIAAARFTVRLTHKRIHAEDCTDCETKNSDIGEISKEVAIEGDISEADRLKLFEIAAKCPVHRTLTNEIKIRSKLAG
jgi:uncharacterized OsmC-like protein